MNTNIKSVSPESISDKSDLNEYDSEILRLLAKIEENTRPKV